MDLKQHRHRGEWCRSIKTTSPTSILIPCKRTKKALAKLCVHTQVRLMFPPLLPFHDGNDPFDLNVTSSYFRRRIIMFTWWWVYSAVSAPRIISPAQPSPSGYSTNSITSLDVYMWVSDVSMSKKDKFHFLRLHSPFPPIPVWAVCSGNEQTERLNEHSIILAKSIVKLMSSLAISLYSTYSAG